MEQDTFSAEELAERMKLHPGTIRNYVCRGVLPPPTGKGQNARYDLRHLHVLMAIATERANRMTMRDWRDRWSATDGVLGDVSGDATFDRVRTAVADY